MGRYRIAYYPNGEVPFKHTFLKRKDDESEYSKKRFDEAYKKLEQKVNEKKLSNNIIRAKTNVTDICLCNDFEYFCTFEFRGTDTVDRYDLKQCYKLLRKFFNNYKTRYAPDFKYLIIPELHPKTGAIHFHGVCAGFSSGDLTIPETIQCRDKRTGELKQIPNKKHYMRWDRYTKALGYFDCSRIRSRNAVAFYITKYVTKELEKIPKGTKIFCCSQGLQRPEIIEDTIISDMPLQAGYEDEFCKIAYDKYDDTLKYFADVNELHPFTGELPCEYTEEQIPDIEEGELPYYEYDYGSQGYNEEYEKEYIQTQLKA